MHLKSEKEKGASVSESANGTGESESIHDGTVDKDQTIHDPHPCQSSDQSSSAGASESIPPPLNPKQEVVHASDIKPPLPCGVLSSTTTTDAAADAVAEADTRTTAFDPHDSSTAAEDLMPTDFANTAEDDSTLTASRRSQRITQRNGELVQSLLLAHI